MLRSSLFAEKASSSFARQNAYLYILNLQFVVQISVSTTETGTNEGGRNLDGSAHLLSCAIVSQYSSQYFIITKYPVPKHSLILRDGILKSTSHYINSSTSSKQDKLT
jgi:hypothetical protein